MKFSFFSKYSASYLVVYLCYVFSSGLNYNIILLFVFLQPTNKHDLMFSVSSEANISITEAMQGNRRVEATCAHGRNLNSL